MQNLKTISGRTISATANNSKRSFTIRVNGSKYRTHSMSVEDFNECLHNTANDWQNYLNTEIYINIIKN